MSRQPGGSHRPIKGIRVRLVTSTDSKSSASLNPFDFSADFLAPSLDPKRSLSPPSYRFPESSQITYGARPPSEEWGTERGRTILRCDGSGHPGGSIAQGCGRIVMEKGVERHLQNTAKIHELEQMVIPPSLPISKRNIASLNGNAGGNKKGGSRAKRAGSEVSQAPTEASVALSTTATPRKLRLATPSTVNGADMPPPSLASSSNAPTVGAPGTVADEEGRLWLENGRKETKKQMRARQAQERRDNNKREEEGDAASKKKGFHWDRNCGVRDDTGSICQRNILCKIHSILDKRAVSERSMPFDECVRRWRAENQGSDPDVTVKRKSSAFDEEEDEIALRDVVSEAQKPAKKRRLRGQGESKAPSDRQASVAGIRDLLENEALGNAEMSSLLQATGQSSHKVDNWAKLRTLALDPDELKNNHIKKGKKAQAAAAALAAQQEAEQAQRAEQSPSNAEEKSAPGGFDFLAPVKNNKKSDPTVPPPSQAVDTAAAAQIPAPKQPVSTMRYQTFAGGATSGAWHLDRRAFSRTEKVFGEIWAALSLKSREAAAGASSTTVSTK